MTFYWTSGVKGLSKFKNFSNHLTVSRNIMKTSHSTKDKFYIKDFLVSVNKYTFSHIRVQIVLGGKKYSLFWKIWRALFSCYLRFEIHLLPYYQRINFVKLCKQKFIALVVKFKAKHQKK